MNQINRLFGAIGCINALSAVALGAFGAHALKSRLADAGMADVWQTAVEYQIWHALALLLCAVLPLGGRFKSIAVALFIAGIVLFCGSLYWLALGGPRWLGPITPMGGLSFMAGWLSLAGMFIQSKQTRKEI